MKLWRGTSTLDGFIDDLEFCDQKSHAELLVIGGKPIVLDEFPRLRGIFKTGVGLDNLPFVAANERGIDVRTIGDTAKTILFEETASFAAHLVIQCLFRNVGEWESWWKRPRKSMASHQVLVVGHGNIGRRTAEKLRGFCQVTIYDAAHNQSSELRPLVEAADCISLHIPATEETRGFIDAEKLSWIKDGAAIVNTARGSVISETDLYEELKSGRIFAALDVFWQEPYAGLLTQLPSSQWLRTPHVASTCEDWLREAAHDLRRMISEVAAKK